MSDLFPTYCKGTTRRGTRCQRKIKCGEKYCYMHSGKDLTGLMAILTIAKSTEELTKPSPGFIYMYTINVDKRTDANVHLFDQKANKYIPIELVNNAHKARCLRRLALKLFATNIKPTIKSPLMLIKVGHTHKRPKKRLQEWQAQCRRPLVLMAPEKHSKQYDASKNGWQTSNPVEVETCIHRELRGLFGQGYVDCQGCNTKHREWFLIQKHLLPVVFKTIDYWVNLYG